MAVAVLLEDAAAVIGVLIVLACIGLYILTGNPIFDAIGSIIIALLLGTVAVFLVSKNRSALLGRTVTQSERAAVIGVLQADPAVEHIHDVKATVMGAETFRFKAEVDFDGRIVAQRALSGQDLQEIFDQVCVSPEALEQYLVNFGEQVVEALGDEIDRIEARIQEEVPAAKHVDLEAD
jgi:zinc transporter 9